MVGDVNEAGMPTFELWLSKLGNLVAFKKSAQYQAALR